MTIALAILGLYALATMGLEAWAVYRARVMIDRLIASYRGKL